MKTKIWLIRHGATDWNTQLRWQGHTDVPLNAVGRAQAARIAEELKDLPLSGILSSDLLRARQTAESIATPHGLTVQTTNKLREVDVGELEGLTRYSVIEHYEESDVERWRDERELDWPFPNGERKRDAQVRGLTAIEEFALLHGDREIAIVFHSLIMRVILHALFPAIEGRVYVPNCKYFELEFNSSSRRWTALGELAQEYLPEEWEATA